MSDLLNQASLVMVPSGYKEDTVYSVVPSDGSGDLSFTRASNGTRVNSAGLVEVCPWNFCDYSEDQTQWTSQNETTVTANSTTAPNGTTTADTVTPSTANDDHYRGIVLGQQVGALTAFIYVKPNGYNFLDWGIWNGSQYIVRATFDLVNLTYTFTNAGTATIESVGNGWLKCGISGTNASLTTMSLYYRSRPTGGTGAFTGNGTSGAFIWGAQLNIGSTAKPYFPTTDRLNVPRLTYQNGGGGCPSLLLEKQSTNDLSYSEEFDNAAWSVKDNLSVTANVTTSPDGTQNADKLVENSSNDQHRIYRSADGTNKMFSFFAKASERSWVSVLCNDGNFTWFDLANGQVGTVAATSTATIENVGNGWYRCVVYNTHGSFGSLIQIATANNVTSYQGNGTSGIFVWGAQLEASSYATSYIPTTSSSATRVADACYKTGISSLIGQTQGSVFFDFTVDTISSQTNNPVLWYMKDGGAGERYVELLANGNLEYVESNGSIIAYIIKSGLTVGRHKCAIAYAPNDMVFYVDGVQIGTDTSGNPSGFSTFSFQYYISVYNGQQKVNQTVIFPTRLTNAELASLTTI